MTRAARLPSQSPIPHSALLIACVAMLGVTLGACATRPVMQPTFERGRVEVSLRSHKRLLGAEIERNFQHPASVSRQRLLHILAAVDVERKDEDQGGLRVRVPAFHADLLDDITAGLTDALEKAGPNQEIVVMAVRKEQRLGLFHRKFLTNFVAFVRDDHLHVSLSRSEWRIPKERSDKPLPLPRLGKKVMEFRVIPGRAMHPAGLQTVVVPWRNPIYAQPVRAVTDSAPGTRRTILFDSPLPEDGETSGGELPDDLSPDVLRDLADLEEARRAGSITETQYLQRRAVLLGETR